MLAMLLVLDATPRLRAALMPASQATGSQNAPIEDAEDSHRTGAEAEHAKQNTRRRNLIKHPPVLEYLPPTHATSQNFFPETHPLAIATEHAMRNGLGAPLRR